MADPFTLAMGGLAAFSSATTLIGGSMAAEGAMVKGQADQQMYNYRAGVAQLNSKIAKQNAEYTVEAGESAIYKEGLELGQTLGRQKAIQGASGIDVNSGTAAIVRQDTEKLGEYDIKTTATNYAKKAYSYEVEAATQEAEAGANLVAGQQSIKAAQINADASILGAVGSVSSKWLQAAPSFTKVG